MSRPMLAGALILLATLVALAAERVAMFTEVVGPVRVRGAQARTLMGLGPSSEVEVLGGARATLTFFQDGHREKLRGPCKVRVSASGAVLLSGASGSLVRTPAAPATVQAPAGQNLRRMGGGLQALADPDSPERAQVVALAGLPGLDEPSGSGAPDFQREMQREPAERPSGHHRSEPSAPPAPAPAPAPLPAPIMAMRGTELSEQRVFALAPVLAWDPPGPVVVTLLRDGRQVWSQACQGSQVTVSEPLPAGSYQWLVEPADGGLPSGADITLLPEAERAAVREAFARARDASDWVALMVELADAGLLAEALAADEEALRSRPDPELHLAAARLLTQMKQAERAREHARQALEPAF